MYENYRTGKIDSVDGLEESHEIRENKSLMIKISTVRLESRRASLWKS